MAITNAIENFRMEVNEEFVKKAEALKPHLHQKKLTPCSMVEIEKSDDKWKAVKVIPIKKLNQMELKQGDEVILDFGRHIVGYFSFMLESAGSPPDAPVHIRVKLGEKLLEIGEETSDYKGELSSGWLQEEFLHVDYLPEEISMPRRYAFRYVQIKVLATSAKYRVVISNPIAVSVTAADDAVVPELKTEDERLKRLDQVGIKTLQECMQDVYEDGPKRDRRLWIGDLRLQALTNYVTFGDENLVKRCLYLFAGLTQNEGRVGACLFVNPKLLVDDTFLFDYSLFFVSCLYDYYQQTGDMMVLKDLYDTACKQINFAKEELDERGIVRDKETWWCFIDWKDGLNKQASAQFIYIMALRQAVELAEAMQDVKRKKEFTEILSMAEKGAMELWDESRGFFVSGKERQISWHSQIWAVIAGIFPQKESRILMQRTIAENPAYKMVTPYMYHHYVEALLACGEQEEARKSVEQYWGAMLDDGADCYYELFSMEDNTASPYGSKVIESYCHAWSCTPSYFIRKYFE